MENASPAAVTATELRDTIVGLADQRRVLVAIAGPPASGKSMLAARLEREINALAAGTAATVPMDGFHLDDAVIEQLGLAGRKGSPATFDTAGLQVLLGRLVTGYGRADVVVPLFDRDLELARAGARIIGPDVRVVLVEGNYLLLDARPWRDMGGSYDLTVMLDAPADTLRQRLEERWAGLDPESRAAKIDGNDLPNARLVRAQSLPATHVLSPAA